MRPTWHLGLYWAEWTESKSHANLSERGTHYRYSRFPSWLSDAVSPASGSLSFGTLPVAGITESRAAEGHTATADVSPLSIATRDGGIGAHGATPVSPCGKIR